MSEPEKGKKETITVDGKEETIEVKPITLLFHDGTLNIQKDDAATISPEETLLYVSELTPERYRALRTNPLFGECFKIIWEKTPPTQVEKVKTSNDAVKHTVGLLGLIFAATEKKVKIFLKFPETYLHPKQQAQLADVFIKLFAPPEEKKK